MMNRTVTLAALFALSIVSLVSAQPAPSLSGSSHAWVTRGQTVDFTLTGDQLAEARKVLVDGAPGIAAELAPTDKPNAKAALVKLSIDANAPLGRREVRIVTPGGVSNKIDLNITALPVIAEKEANNTPATAQLVTLPATIHGEINGGTDVDVFRFTARKGDKLVFEVFAQRQGSALDSSLKLHDAAGREIARSEDAIGTDSLIAYDAPEDGEYVLQLHDVQYRGGGNYDYRINAGAIPYAQAVFPLGGKRGSSIEVKLTGWNLPAATMKVDLTNKPAGRTTIFATPDGAANPLTFEVSESDEFIEAEPNQAVAQANLLPSLPVVINGVIGQPGDADVFRFKVEKPAKWRFSVDAMQLGSRLDALLTLHDAAGNVIARTDDAAPGADAAIERDLGPGDYHVSVTELTSLGSASHGYRLSIAPPKPALPDFTIRFFPDTLRIHRGGRTLVQCEVQRSGGFNGPVTVVLKNPPKGVTAKPVEIPIGPTSGLFVIEAAADADLTFGSLALMATGAQGEIKIERTAQPLVRVQPVQAAYVAVLDALPFALNQAKPLTDEEVQQAVAKIAALEAQLLAPHAELDAAAAAWEQKALATVQGDISLSPWHHIGPFAAASFDEGFDKDYGPEKEADLKKEIAGRKWEPKPQWLDGQVWNEFSTDSAANYIIRTIEVAADRALELSLGSDDAIKVWHNGKEVLANKVGRGAMPDQEKVTLQLKAGKNTLLMKIVNGSGPSGFYFKANAQTHGIPADLVAALKTAAPQRSEAQKLALQKEHRLQAPQLQPVRDQIATLRKRIGVREEMAVLRKKIVTPTPELLAAQAAWEKNATVDTWSALEFTDLKSVGGAQFARLSDGSILLSGAAQSQDTYTFKAVTDLKNITAIRLEALADKTLPAGGPGRAENGNFVLTQFNVMVASQKEPAAQAKLNLHSPMATFEQAGWPIVNTLDGNDATGWAVSPQFNKDHTAMFRVKDFTGHEGGTILHFTLRNESPHVKHTLGRFRISVTTHAKPDLKQPSLPAGIVKIIATAADKRDAKQQQELTAYFLAFAPQLAADRDRLAALEAAGTTGNPSMKYNQTTTLAFEINRAAGFAGDITITALGFASGRDAQGNPNVIAKDIEVAPLVIKGDQSMGTLTLKAKDKSEVGTRTLVLQAEAMVGGQKVTQISETIAVTITP